MKKNTLILSCLALSLFAFNACKSDDSDPVDDTTVDPTDDYVPIEITAELDNGEGFQDETIELQVLLNDANVPADGTLTLGAAQTGTLTVQDVNNTPNNITDDIVIYTPNANTYSESDSFQYTVCDAEGLSCDTGDVALKIFRPIAANNLDAMPFATLSEYNFFYSDLKNQEAVPGVLPYEPISSLFSDYAKKKRFVWMPEGVSATYNADGALLDFPEGAVIVKSFYYDNVLPSGNTQIIETRLLIKKEGAWVFADYIWDSAQQEAFLDTAEDGGTVDLSWIQDGVERTVEYRIPSTSQCFTCHKSFGNAIPIGVKPQNLNGLYDFNDGESNQLQKWIEIGYLEDNLPGNINTVVDYHDESEDLDLRVRSYLDINCASCHMDGGHCDYRSLRFEFNMTEDPNNLGICIDPDTPIDGFSKLVAPGDADSSVLFFRISTEDEQYRMPLLGRTLVQDDGVALVREWIESLSETCN